ncbi:MAG: hypothetical protein KGN79_13200 [Acidobacteriota bacterium]|nr:hypothetical protein [Acidobacteriota bacterium]
MKKAVLLVLSGLLLVAGCNSGSNKSAGIPVKPKWKGPAYHIAFGDKQAKPDKSGVTLPNVTWDANPDAVERRATLVVRFDSSGVKTDKLIVNQVVLAPFDISGTKGSLPADALKYADEGLAHLLTSYCVNGKVKVQIRLEKSSLSPQPSDEGINDNALSDWLSTEIDFKNPKKHCTI